MEQLVKQILDKENIKFNTITKSTSGFTNLVYFIDDKFVIKLTKDVETKKQLIKETKIYQNIKIQGIPTMISAGECEDYRYLIMTKIKGKALYSIWHTLTSKERKSCISQIVNILKQFHNQNADFLDNRDKDVDWIGNLTNKLNNRIEGLKDLGYNTTSIENFVKEDLPKLFKDNQFALVYNDAHFDNFIYDNGKLSLIDFDRVRYCPIDYEMLIFKTMCDNPSKFASEEDEDKIVDEHYAGIYEQFKAEYPEMFKGKNVENRIKVYQFNYLIKQAIDIKRHAWIQELLNQFEQDFVQGKVR
ncbi:MAG: phosphotransferase [Clostridia bacterium]